MKKSVHLQQNRAEFLSEGEMPQTEFVEKIKTYISCTVFFFPIPENRAIYEITWKSVLRVRQATVDNMAHAH